MKNFKTVIIIAFLVSVCLSLTVPASAADPEAQNIIQRMIGSVSKVNLPSGGDDVDTRAETIVGTIIGLFLGIMGILFLGLMVYGGYKWMIAQGREEEVTKAKDVIKQAITGLGIVIAAYAISYFVISQFWAAAK